MLVVSWRATCR